MAKWESKGAAKVKGDVFEFRPISKFGRAMVAAMRDAAAKFVIAFYADPSVRKCLGSEAIRAAARVPLEKTLSKAIAIFCSAIAVQACVPFGDVAVPIELTVPNNPLVERLPLQIGVYFEPQLRTYEYSVKDIDVGAGYENHLRTFKFAVGPKSIQLFKSVLGSMFVKVVELTALPPAPGNGSAVDAVVAIDIDDFGVKFFGKIFRRGPAAGGGEGSHRASVTYKFNLYSPSTNKISSYSVTGSGDDPIASFRRIDTALGLAVGEAMRAAGAKFIVAFHEDPAISSWLASRDVAMPDRGGDNR